MKPLSRCISLSHTHKELSFERHQIRPLRFDTKGFLDGFHALSYSAQLLIRHRFIIIAVCFSAVQHSRLPSTHFKPLDFPQIRTCLTHQRRSQSFAFCQTRLILIPDGTLQKDIHTIIPQQTVLSRVVCHTRHQRLITGIIIFYNLIIPFSEMCCKYLLPLILRKQPCFSDVCPDITFKEQRRTHDLLAHFCPLIVPDHSPAAILCFYKDHRYVLQTFALNRSLIKILKVDTNIRILFP